MKYLLPLLFVSVFALTGCAIDRRAEIAKQTLYGWKPLSSSIQPVPDPVFTATLNKRFPAGSGPNAVRNYVEAMGGGCSVLGGAALASFRIKVEESKKNDLACGVNESAGFCAKTDLLIDVHIEDGVIVNIEASHRSSYC